MSTLQRAIEIATQAHQGQVDKSGKDYIGHPLRVMEMDAELARLWSEGTSVADIANHFGRKNSAIITRIKKQGL